MPSRIPRAVSEERSSVISRLPGCADDARDDERAVLGRGRVQKREFAGQAGTDLVRARRVAHRNRMRGRFDAGEVEALKLVDVAEDRVELRLERRDLLVSECETSQERDVTDVGFGDGHARVLPVTRTDLAILRQARSARVRVAIARPRPGLSAKPTPPQRT